MTVDFVEVGPRNLLYEVVPVHGPVREEGREWLCYVKHSAHAVLVSDRVRACDRDGLVRRTASRAVCRPSMIPTVPLRPVPIRMVG
jgi:hypothetical protein